MFADLVIKGNALCTTVKAFSHSRIDNIPNFYKQSISYNRVAANRR